MKQAQTRDHTSSAVAQHPPARLYLYLPSFAGILSVLTLCFSLQAQAQSLPELLSMALTSEPNYQGAAAGLRAAEARSREAKSALLLQINGTANTNDNKRNYQIRETNLPPQKDQYNSHAWQLNITLPLFRYGAIADKLQANALKSQADFQLAAAEQMLIAKLVESWLDVLATRDNINFTKAQELAALQQLEIIIRGGNRGLYSLPQEEEARAKYVQAQTEKLMANADLEVKRAELEQLTGTLSTLETPVLNGNASLIPELGKDTLQDWLDAIVSSNADIRAAVQAVDGAREDVRKQFAGHLPTIDLVGNYGLNSQVAGGFPGQNGYEIKQGYAGLQANWTLFSSGAQSNKVREARAMLDKAEASLENTRRTVINNTKQAWYGLQVAQAKSRASRQAVVAARLALNTADSGTASGLKSELDILQARQQLAAAERDLSKARYDQITTLIKLKSLTGTLNMTDVIAVQNLFIAEPDSKGDLSHVSDAQSPPGAERLVP